MMVRNGLRPRSTPVPGRPALVAVAAVAVLAAGCRPLTVGLPAGAGCATGWGSTDEHTWEMGDAPVVDVRAGRHACFDRVVVDLAGPVRPGWTVRYVDVVREPGRGSPVPVAGGAALELVVRAPAYAPIRRPTFAPDDRRAVVGVDGFDTIRQVAYAGSFEGQTHFAVGVRARLPFRVVWLPGPDGGSRVVVDVAHRWR